MPERKEIEYCDRSPEASGTSDIQLGMTYLTIVTAACSVIELAKYVIPNEGILRARITIGKLKRTVRKRDYQISIAE